MRTEDLADKIVNLFRDETIGEENAERLRGQLLIVIAAAVAAEHQRTKERCAKVATDYHSDDCDDQCCTCRPIAAAIRALP